MDVELEDYIYAGDYQIIYSNNDAYDFDKRNV